MKLTLKIFTLTALLIASAALLVIAGCGDDDDDDDNDDATGSGTLEFYANGEEFIRDGFTGKTGWDITFDHFYMNIQGATAYQVVESTSSAQTTLKHAGHPHEDIPEGTAHEALTDAYYLDLHEGDDRQLIDSVTGAAAGNYNYVAFSIVQADDGEYSGYSIVMIGTAVKGDEAVTFNIKLDEEMTFSTCKQELDDEYAGVVDDGGTGSVELTFHSDHIFGDADEALDDPLSVNPGAIGFQPFADLDTDADGVINVDQSDIEADFDSNTLGIFLAALYTIGHSGEGHCEYSAYSEETEE